MKTQLKTKIIYGDYEIPVEIGTLVKQFKVKTEGSCPHCEGKTGAKKYCKDCNEELGWTEPLKAYSFSKDDKQIITDEQSKALQAQTKEIIVKGTIQNDRIDIRSTLGGYYLGIKESESTSEKTIADENATNTALFSVLYEGLKNTNKSLVVEFAVGSEQKLGILIADQKTIILKQVTYKDEVQEFDHTEPEQLDDEQVKMGVGFIESLKEIDPQSIENKSKELLETILKGEPLPVIEQKKPSLNFFKQK